MIHWGHYHLERREDTGHFDCPQCEGDQTFTLLRTWNYFHIYFIPLLKQQLVAEKVLCNRCSSAFPITVLSKAAKTVTAFDADRDGAHSFFDNFGNVIEFTDAACEEIKRRLSAGKFGAEAVVRITPDSMAPNHVGVLFDFALADGRDWIGKSRGIPVVVDRNDARELQGAKVDFRDGTFVRSQHNRSPGRPC